MEKARENARRAAVRRCRQLDANQNPGRL